MGHSFEGPITNNLSEKLKGKEYVYLLDMIWKPGHLGHFPIEKNSIMTSVGINDNGRFFFTCKKTGEKYCTFYGWALAELTDDNVKIIKDYQLKQEKLEQMKKTVDATQKLISTLEIFENPNHSQK